ncbi:alpha/beta fold hydrolase [Catenisphaera adipataccumulans]|jgi:pimeloyl-ACP methyl ester carboxylesterase|uniref:Pimeloyl-ACP methyl ester carboxylesterase n=1 Tax=Catenisphaera adipataccumulans TaxID=700500 RepID=A0A7W8CW93_9FIRM|nr:alpha/beta hydrolase [Catenisphaera adipataccumulans]MBB5182766.1 pimeloyl-ACP methyl ester carboxylesterase [Catenisphaera adipataccumulans]
MEYKRYIHKKKPVMMYIHGECLSAFSFKTQVKEFKKDFEIVLPLLNDSFTSIQQTAEELIQYIDEQYDGHIQVLAGFSLGAQIVTEMLSQRNDLCEFAMVESALLLPSKLRNWSDLAAVHAPTLSHNKLFNSFMYYAKFSDDAAEHEYYENLKTIPQETLARMYDETYNYQLPDSIKDYTGKLAILVGQRESKKYKESADLLHDKVAGSEIFMLLNYSHGGLSLGHPEEYIRFVKSWVQQKDKQQRKAAKKKQEEEEGEYMPNWKHLLNRYKAKKAARASRTSL